MDLEALNDENGNEVLTELLEFLSRWLYHHILGSDTMIGKMPALDEEEDPFAFTEKYKLGVELIDSEHQRLFEIIRETNELTNDVLFNDKYDDIKKIISELKDYTIKHFGDEEEYMEKIGYSGLEAQKVAHQLSLIHISIILCLSNFGIGGSVGNKLSSVFFGLFGLVSYIFPIGLVLLTAFGLSNKGNKVAWLKRCV